ncbi:MAG: chloride channel protein [candidate division Zixibacteria bacterium]|nr:chloride channel protein [candidate division Zixibacteria bacterium]
MSKQTVQQITSTLRRVHADVRRTEHIYMVLVALVIGLLGGLCAVGFRELIHFGQLASWGYTENLVYHIQHLPWWWKIGIPTFGGLCVGLITYYFAREAKGHGVPEVIEAVTLHGGRIRFRVVIAKMIASGICIATGGSVGREGPIVQIGSSLGSTIGQWLGIDERRLQTLVGCGAAAGIAATFNAPVAGALFAVEIILGDFGVAQFSPIVISSVSATVVSQHFLGDFPAFNVPGYSLVSPFELFAYVGLGLIAGVIAVAFIKSLYGLEDFFDGIPLYPPLKTTIGGIIIGLIAMAFPQVLGVGYETINQALSGNMVFWLLLIMIAMKIFAVSITIGSGGSGGIFAPSLFIGAMTGGVVGTMVNNFWPGAVASPGAYALVGMAAIVAAATHAPITAILIVFELTNDYKIILPLMITCIIATIIATRLQKESIYTLKLLRRGLDIHKGRSIDVLQNHKVSDIMRTEFTTIQIDAPLMSIISRFVDQPGNSVFVLDRSQHLRGLITLDEVRPIIDNTQSLKSLLIAKDLMIEQGFPVFHPDDSLADVMKRLSGHVHEAPVVRNGGIVGSIWPDDLIARYNAELFKCDMVSGMASSISGAPPQTCIPGVCNLKLAEMKIPIRYVGQSIVDLNIRKRFGVTILLLKRPIEGHDELVDTVPTADTVFENGDIVLVMGSDQGLTRFERS